MIIFTLLAIEITWFGEQDDIEQKIEEANIVQNERVKKNLTIRYEETRIQSTFNYYK